MKKRYEAPVVEIVEVGVACLLVGTTSIPRYDDDDYGEIL